MFKDTNLEELETALISLIAQLDYISDGTEDPATKNALHAITWYQIPAMIKLTETHPDEE